ncbi:TadE/TadG family type IV pilus assembly protein [Roseicyclus persicicus]|uniref:Pilus assembly protein n=1 Tax=Roseicyclus persicicus TaxID=2650661 RepID=A0A7X6GXZ0_9RHOB|nr:hypothetical protein [Roseibacterium persicicum]NKX43192.1 hypothetical protein [Roseibacterium persicicum]
MRRVRAMGRALGRFGGGSEGSVAVEFGLFAAMLVPVFVLAFDLGFLLRERIVMEHTLRAGIFAAIQPDSTRTTVEDAMQAAFAGQDGARVTLETLSVAESCFCPDAPAQAVSCTATCEPDAVFGAYTISLSLGYDGVLLPSAVQSGLGMLGATIRVEFPAWAR